jgi:hypothetical protein
MWWNGNMTWIHGEDIEHLQKVVKETSFTNVNLESAKGETDPKIDGWR